MDIKFYIPKATTGNIKCTLHKNGKMGFSKQAIEKLHLKTNGYSKLGFNADDSSDKSLYMIIQE